MILIQASLGGPMHATVARMGLKRITGKAASAGTARRELRPTFVSLLPDSGVPVEQV